MKHPQLRDTVVKRCPYGGGDITALKRGHIQQTQILLNEAICLQYKGKPWLVSSEKNVFFISVNDKCMLSQGES